MNEYIERKEDMLHSWRDMKIGEVYNGWKIIKPIKIKNKTVLRCQCIHCQKIVNRAIREIQRQNCRCQFIQYDKIKIGDIYNKYLILDIDKTGKQYIWQCQCPVCKKITFRNLSHLKERQCSHRGFESFVDHQGNPLNINYIIENKKPIHPGRLIGEWKVIERGPGNTSSDSYWYCQNTISQEVILIRGTSIHSRNLAHIWYSILSRCYNKKNKDYRRYGGRGIYVCDRWYDINNFITDIPFRPSLQHSLDRINNNWIYIEENIRWATSKEQLNNMRRNILLTVDGITLTVGQWVEKMEMVNNINHILVYQRIKNGWTHREAVLTPVHIPKSLAHQYKLPTELKESLTSETRSKNNFKI